METGTQTLTAEVTLKFRVEVSETGASFAGIELDPAKAEPVTLPRNITYNGAMAIPVVLSKTNPNCISIVIDGKAYCIPLG